MHIIIFTPFHRMFHFRFFCDTLRDLFKHKRFFLLTSISRPTFECCYGTKNCLVIKELFSFPYVFRRLVITFTVNCLRRRFPDSSHHLAFVQIPRNKIVFTLYPTAISDKEHVCELTFLPLPVFHTIIRLPCDVSPHTLKSSAEENYRD